MTGTCKTCDKPLGRGNASGYCIHHVSAFNAQDPEWRARQRKGIERKLLADPEYLERKREDMRKAHASRDLEKLRERMLANRYWELSNAQRPKGHSSRIKAGRTVTATRLAWCPPHLRDQYRHLNRVMHIPAVRAREMILEQHEKDMREFRKRIGA